ncbi:hypothetical protein FOZ63_009822, partial [Perkinsus olseni]
DEKLVKLEAFLRASEICSSVLLERHGTNVKYAIVPEGVSDEGNAPKRIGKLVFCCSEIFRHLSAGEVFGIFLDAQKQLQFSDFQVGRELAAGKIRSLAGSRIRRKLHFCDFGGAILGPVIVLQKLSASQHSQGIRLLSPGTVFLASLRYHRRPLRGSSMPLRWAPLRSNRVTKFNTITAHSTMPRSRRR